MMLPVLKGLADGKKIALIDGQMPAGLMIDHDLGVAPGKTFQLKKVDSDFFED